MASWLAFFDGQLPGHPAFAHDDDAVAHAQDFGQLRRDHDDRLAFPSELVHQGVDFALGPDVDAARGLVENEDVAVADEPFRDDHLLLVAAGQVPQQLLQGGRLDVELMRCIPA